MPHRATCYIEAGLLSLKNGLLLQMHIFGPQRQQDTREQTPPKALYPEGNAWGTDHRLMKPNRQWCQKVPPEGWPGVGNHGCPAHMHDLTPGSGILVVGTPAPTTDSSSPSGAVPPPLWRLHATPREEAPHGANGLGRKLTREVASGWEARSVDSRVSGDALCPFGL